MINFLKDIKEMMMTRMGNIPDYWEARDVLQHLLNFQNFQFTELTLEYSNSMWKIINETLLRFIIGKLADHPATRDVIIKEIATFVVQHSYNPHTGRVLSVSDMLSLVWDLKCESLPDDYNHNVMDSYPESYSALVTSPLVYFRPTRRFPSVANLETRNTMRIESRGFGRKHPRVHTEGDEPHQASEEHSSSRTKMDTGSG